MKPVDFQPVQLGTLLIQRILPAALVVLVISLGMPSYVRGQGVRGIWSDLIRGTARVADDVPVKHVDDLVHKLSKSRAVRESVDAQLKKASRVTKRGASRSDEVIRLLRSTANQVDPQVLRRIEKLDAGTRDVALVLARGGDDLARTVPDLATRGRLLRAGGAETVATVGMFGPDAARAALRLDEAIRGGAVVVRDGSRAVNAADFGRVMTRLGDGGWKFWNTYVQPHWKLWAASGALAVYLANPEYFQDAAGNLTEAGFKHLVEFAGEVVAAAIRGGGEGAGSAAENVGGAIWKTYFTTTRGLYAAIGTLVLLGGVSLLFRRVRYWVLRPFRWLNRVPHTPAQPKT